MVRDLEMAALRAVADAYQRWAEISEQLQRDVAEAAEHNAGAPVDSLRADFNAQLALTKAVAAFAQSCPTSGPDVDGLPGAAYVSALYQVIVSQPNLDQELAELTCAWDLWLDEVRRWVPEPGRPAPARPISSAHSRVLAVVDDWWDFGADRLHEQVVESIAAQGHQVTQSTTAGPDGAVLRSAHVTFERAPETDAQPLTRLGPLARLRSLIARRNSR